MLSLSGFLVKYVRYQNRFDWACVRVCVCVAVHVCARDTTMAIAIEDDDAEYDEYVDNVGSDGWGRRVATT